MGCGSSSLKGDAPTGVNDDPAPRPATKVPTNFNTVDYDTSGEQRRQTEYAPHETDAQPSGIDEAVEHAKNGLKDDEAPGAKEGETLKPYQTIDGDEPSGAPGQASGQQQALSNGVHEPAGGDGLGPNPLSAKAMEESARENDPMRHSATNGIVSSSDAKQGNNNNLAEVDNQRRSSWLGKKYKQYSDARDGRGRDLSDEDLRKYTGKGKNEIKEMIESGEGVGRGQSASAIETTGPGTGFAGLVGTSAGGGGF